MKRIILGLTMIITSTAFAQSIKPTDLLDTHLLNGLQTLKEAHGIERNLETVSNKKIKENLDLFKKVLALQSVKERNACTSLGYAYGIASSNSVHAGDKELIEILNPAILFCNKDRLQDSDLYKETSRMDAIKAIDEALKQLGVQSEGLSLKP